MNAPTENILDRLARADREHQKESGGAFLLRGLPCALVLVLGVFVVDVALHLGAGWRLALVLVWVAGGLGLAGVAAWLAWVRRNRLEHVARLLEARDPGLGSKLINLLQLHGQAEEPTLSPLTRQLAARAVAEYAAALGSAPLERLARTDALRRQGQRAALALLVFAAVLAAFYRISEIEVARFLDPYGDHPPYSFTQLEITEPRPAGTNVIYGRSLIVQVRSRGHQPKEVYLTAQPPEHPEQALTLAMFDKGRAGFSQQLDNVRTELEVWAHTKDRVSVSKRVRVGVVLTPQLDLARVQVVPPTYTGLKSEEKVYAFKGLQALAGSEIRFRLQSNRPLIEGRLEFTAGGQAPVRSVLNPSATNEVAASFAAVESGRLRFELVDTTGIASAGSWEDSLTVTHDLPPEIVFTDPENDCLVALDFRLPAHFEAKDDYGLASVRLHRGLNGVFSAPKVIPYGLGVRDCRETLEFDFAGLGVAPGDIVSLFTEALDNAPEPHLARSAILRLLVITVDQYNNRLREETDLNDVADKYAALQADLQDLIEEQRQLGQIAQTNRADLARTNAASPETPARALDDLLAKQNELNQKLNQLSRRLDEFVRPDPLYDVEQEFQDLLEEQAMAIRQSTRTNDAQAYAIAQRSAPTDGSRLVTPTLLDDFQQAAQDQVARLAGARQEAQTEIVQTLEDMSLMQELQKDYGLFESLYRTQQELAAQAQAYNRPGELSREDLLALKDLAASQKQVGESLDQLEEKLRADADAAEKLFPKAARSGRDLAGQIGELRLAPLARQATGAMLEGSGERAFGAADRLRGEMEKLFAECQGGQGPSGNELDAYLRLTRGMQPGNNFAQMALSRKFGRGTGRGQGLGMGQGYGLDGKAGYAVMTGPQIGVKGNESPSGRSNARSRDTSRIGKGRGELSGGAKITESDKADTLKELNPVNRQSGAVVSENPIDEYQNVVDSYFKAITAKKKKQTEEVKP